MKDIVERNIVREVSAQCLVNTPNIQNAKFCAPFSRFIFAGPKCYQEIFSYVPCVSKLAGIVYRNFARKAICIAIYISLSPKPFLSKAP